MFLDGSSKRGVGALLNAVDLLLPNRDHAIAKDFLDHNEWGLAFEHVCTQLYEHEVTIDQTLYDEINRLGVAMKLDDSGWLFLKELLR
jgi:hypothetical protein